MDKNLTSIQGISNNSRLLYFLRSRVMNQVNQNTLLHLQFLFVELLLRIILFYRSRNLEFHVGRHERKEYGNLPDNYQYIVPN